MPQIRLLEPFRELLEPERDEVRGGHLGVCHHIRVVPDAQHEVVGDTAIGYFPILNIPERELLELKSSLQGLYIRRSLVGSAPAGLLAILDQRYIVDVDQPERVGGPTPEHIVSIALASKFLHITLNLQLP